MNASHRNAKFFIVVGPGPSSKRHGDYAEAWVEAARLADENRGADYYVAQAVEHIRIERDVIHRAVCELPEKAPELYEPIDGAKFPMHFSVMSSNYPTIGNYVFLTAYNEKQLDGILWSHDPINLTRVPRDKIKEGKPHFKGGYFEMIGPRNDAMFVGRVKERRFRVPRLVEVKPAAY